MSQKYRKCSSERAEPSRGATSDMTLLTPFTNSLWSPTWRCKSLNESLPVGHLPLSLGHLPLSLQGAYQHTRRQMQTLQKWRSIKIRTIRLLQKPIASYTMRLQWERLIIDTEVAEGRRPNILLHNLNMRQLVAARESQSVPSPWMPRACGTSVAEGRPVWTAQPE